MSGVRGLLVISLAGMLVTAPAADAAFVAVKPVKTCYRTGEKPAFGGIGFTPLRAVNVTADGVAIGSLATTNRGWFAGTLTVAQARGEKVKTYAATDQANPLVTASVQLRVSAVSVRVRPASGVAGQRVRIRARGFTTGKRLWAHVRGRVDRNVKVGRLRRSCHKLRKRRRIIPAGAPNGSYIVQFDTRRKYKRSRKVKVRFSVTVYPVFGARLSTGEAWRRLD